jgi:hypothetical protein
MSFNVYTKEGFHLIAWFDTIDQAIKSMKDNPRDYYHRIVK